MSENLSGPREQIETHHRASDEYGNCEKSQKTRPTHEQPETGKDHPKNKRYGRYFRAIKNALFKKRQPSFMEDIVLKGFDVSDYGFITAEAFANHGFQISLRVSYLAVTLALVPIFQNALLFCAVYLLWWLILACVGYFRNSRKPRSENLLELREIAQGRFILAIGGLCVAWSGSYIASGALFFLCATLCALNDAFLYKRVRFAKFLFKSNSRG